MLFVDACEGEIEVGGRGLELKLLLQKTGCALEVSSLGTGLREKYGGLGTYIVRKWISVGEFCNLVVSLDLREQVDEMIECREVGLVVSKRTPK